MGRGRNEEGEGRRKNSAWRSAAPLSVYSRLNWTVTGLETTCTYVTFHVESDGKVRFFIKPTVQEIKTRKWRKIGVSSRKTPFLPRRRENSQGFFAVSVSS